jgi:hypothetical protein
MSVRGMLILHLTTSRTAHHVLRVSLEVGMWYERGVLAHLYHGSVL